MILMISKVINSVFLQHFEHQLFFVTARPDHVNPLPPVQDKPLLLWPTVCSKDEGVSHQEGLTPIEEEDLAREKETMCVARAQNQSISFVCVQKLLETQSFASLGSLTSQTQDMPFGKVTKSPALMATGSPEDGVTTHSPSVM